jgi:hypothetical protein
MQLAEGASMPGPTALDKFLAAGRASGRLYGVLDAARDERIHPRLREFAATERIASLYQGASAVELAAVAPYLVSFAAESPMLDWLRAEGWGKAWFTLLWSGAGFDALRDHWRGFGKVRVEDGRVLLFRLYDPRVLRTLLPTCDAAQTGQIFGPISAFGVETRNGPRAAMDVLTHTDGILNHKELASSPGSS